jgi:outer membrane biosynthesis protein TonB
MTKWIVCLVLGLSLASLSTGAAGRDDNEVRCDGAIMSPGDLCETRSSTGSVTKTETYDEMKADQEAGKQTFETWGRWALLGGGLALAGLGVWGIVRERRRRKNAGPTTADMYLRQQGAQPPHMPVPQQGAQPPHMPVPQQQPAHPPQHHPGPQQQQPAQQQPAQQQQQRPAPGPAPFGPGSGDDVTQRLR